MKMRFVNSLTSRLKQDAQTPGEPFKISNITPLASTPRPVMQAHFSYVRPEPSPDVKLVSLNRKAATDLLNLDESEATADILSGNQLMEGTNPWSLNYGGHQFGVWAGQLGDGRAISLGEVIDSKNHRWELQLKGAGRTPYSRFADGYAVLRSSIREYLCAENMNAIGIPTSRSLSIVSTSRVVYREDQEQGAIVCRLAPSWIRFGSFELFFSRGDFANLKLLADYTIETHFPNVFVAANQPSNKYLLFLKEVVERTADMIAWWQSVGFCHGVMNTDNMSILGITIDYGPFQFMDIYNPAYICNHSDEMGRYAFYKQPSIAIWNLSRLASTLSVLMAKQLPDSPDPPLIPEKEEQAINGELVKVLTGFSDRWDATFSKLLRDKLGLVEQRSEDMTSIFQPLLQLMHEMEVDYTHFFRAFSYMSIESGSISEQTFQGWSKFSVKSSVDWDVVVPSESDEPSTSITTRFQTWYNVYRTRLISEHPSEAISVIDSKRKAIMLRSNPKYVLRNHIVAETIKETERNPASDAVDRYLKVLMNPFDEGTPQEQHKFLKMVNDEERSIKCSCSS